MPTNTRFAILFTTVATLLITVGTTCATEPKPRPTALDPSNPAAPESASAATAPTYTCPMHPEVISDKPGRCEKCGMKLVAKEPARDDKK